MKKIIFFFSIAYLMFVSCNKEVTRLDHIYTGNINVVDEQTLAESEMKLKDKTIVDGDVIIIYDSLVSLSFLGKIEMITDILVIKGGKFENYNELTNLQLVGKLQLLGENITDASHLGNISVGRSLELHNFTQVKEFPAIHIGDDTGQFIKLNLTNNSSLEKATFNGANDIEQLTFTQNLQLKEIAIPKLKKVEYFISNSNGFRNFDGFRNLTEIESLWQVSNMENLQNFEGMENLQKIGGDWTISSNPSLVSLKGLENLKAQVEGTKLALIAIKNNKQLEDVCALKTLATQKIENDTFFSDIQFIEIFTKNDKETSLEEIANNCQ